MVMRRDGSKSSSRAYRSLGQYGFPAPDLSDHSPMLFVDLLTRPGHQGKALREPRLRHRLRISIILLLRQHVFHSWPPMGGWGYPYHQVQQFLQTRSRKSLIYKNFTIENSIWHYIPVCEEWPGAACIVTVSPVFGCASPAHRTFPLPWRPQRHPGLDGYQISTQCETRQSL